MLHRGKALGSKIGCRKARIDGSAMEGRMDDDGSSSIGKERIWYSREFTLKF
jgi:hypothetical protein